MVSGTAAVGEEFLGITTDWQKTREPDVCDKAPTPDREAR
jgi:hypothetical protein